MAAAAAALLAIALVLACGDSEEEVAPDPSVTPAASGTRPAVVTLAPTMGPGTPVPVPSDWKTYTNAELGFSVAYPQDLEVTEPPEGPGGERDVEFKSKEYGFAVAASPAGTEAYTFDQFADEQCPRGKREVLLGGYPAITCEYQTPVKDLAGTAVVAQHNAWFYVISAAYWPDETQLAAMFQSFRFMD
jgi:hypothetical protein